jgi:diguanylate cyclase (GGDEF)-like protein
LVNRLSETPGMDHCTPALVTYMTIVTVVGFTVMAQSLFVGSLPGFWTTILHVILGMIGEHLYIRFQGSTVLSLGETVAFAALWYHGVPLAMVSLAIPILTRIVTQERAVLDSAFNAAQSGISLYLASLVMNLSHPWQHDPKGEVLGVLLMIVCYDLVNTILVSTARAMYSGRRLDSYFVKIAYSDRKNSLVAWYMVNMTTTLLSLHLGNVGTIFVFAGMLTLWSQMKSEQERQTSTMEARTDPLTGLGNLRYLEDWLNLDFPRIAKRKMTCSVMFVDVDCLKNVNDSMGHDAGDAVLINLASVLRSVVRADDKIVRYGGDEFLIILKRTTLKDATAIGQRVIDALRKVETHYEGQMVRFGVSIGISSFPKHTTLGRDLIRMADKAMYLAKKSGGNAVCSADSL